MNRRRFISGIAAAAFAAGELFKVGQTKKVRVQAMEHRPRPLCVSINPPPDPPYFGWTYNDEGERVDVTAAQARQLAQAWR